MVRRSFFVGVEIDHGRGSNVAVLSDVPEAYTVGTTGNQPYSASAYHVPLMRVLASYLAVGFNPDRGVAVPDVRLPWAFYRPLRAAGRLCGSVPCGVEFDRQ